MPLEVKKINLVSHAFFRKNGILTVLLFLFILISIANASTTKTEFQPSPSPTFTPIVSHSFFHSPTPALPEVMGETTQLPSSDKQLFSVVSVVDGDTFKIEIDGKVETVRIVGINTPETVDPRRSVECFGQQASDKLKEILKGKRVDLESDETQSDRDRYQRLLRFVFLEDGSDVGLTLIQQGYAHESLYSSQPHKYRTQYVQAQTEAQQNKRGLWGEEMCSTTILNNIPSPMGQQLSVDGHSCTGPDLDCSDFKTQAEAQNFFDRCGFSKTNDPMKLDGMRSGDGVVCESLP